MRIKSIRIKNFRSFKDSTIMFDDYTSLVGPNGAGKSTVLCALNVFFREVEASATDLSDLDVEDFHERDTTDPIEITVTFKDLNEDAQSDFADYFRQDELTVTAKAVFDQASGIASVKQFGQRLAIEQFKAFFQLYNDGKPVADLRAEYGKLRAENSDLPAINTKDGMRDALRAHEEANPTKCVLIPSEDQFYGFSKGRNRLACYVQWIYVPAVKDATKENVEAKNTALGKILARTVRSKVKFGDEISKLKEETLERYRQLLATQQNALDEISKSLTQRLIQWAHPEAKARVAWTEDPKKTVQVDEPVARLLAGEGEFVGELARFGHGLQRSYLLAVLQELASTEDADAPVLILGCEEPELYQHPPQARHLAGVMQQLADGNAQILVSTHSPYFISGRHFESLRMVRRDSVTKQSEVSSVTFDAIATRIADVSGEKPNKPAAQEARLQQALQPHLNEMFFAPKIVFVEGIEDAAYITSWLILSGKWDEFRRHGAHLVPANGKSYLIEPIIVAQALRIPVFAVFDADGNITNTNQRPKHERDNKALLTLLEGDFTQPFPTSVVWSNKFVQWPTNLGDTLKMEVGQNDWDQSFGEATKGLGNPEGSYAKNPLHIGNHLEILQSKGKAPQAIEKLCQELIRFAAST
jgi:putative ATP-dependent endonuclease of OLD family